MSAATELHVVHASLDTFHPDPWNESDVKNVMRLEPDWCSFTETGQASTVGLIRDVAGHDFHVLNPDKGDITFILRKEHRLKAQGGPVIIPAQGGKPSEGAHTARCNSWFNADVYGEDVFGNAVHLVTKMGHHKQGGPDRSGQQDKQANALGKQMSGQARGRSLSIGAGDLNASLPADASIQEIFDKYGMTTTAKEAHVLTPTHGPHRIDYMWTMDKDGRVSVLKFRVHREQVFKSDHDPLDAVLRVRS